MCIIGNHAWMRNFLFLGGNNISPIMYSLLTTEEQFEVEWRPTQQESKIESMCHMSSDNYLQWHQVERNDAKALF